MSSGRKSINSFYWKWGFKTILTRTIF